MNAAAHPSLAAAWTETRGLRFLVPSSDLDGAASILFTTRTGGHSRDDYESLNLAFHVNDVPERVQMNRRALTNALGRRQQLPVVAEQVHGAHAARVGPLHAGTRWEQPERALSATDALVTSAPLLPLTILVADCAPVALVDPVRRVAGAIHAGWRGLTAGVVERTWELMEATWGCSPDDVLAWIGPSIGPCCYEVGPDVAREFPSRFLTAGVGDRSMLDLSGAVVDRLIGLGLSQSSVSRADQCTCCLSEHYFSYRRARREGRLETGRQAMLIWLNSNR